MLLNVLVQNVSDTTPFILLGFQQRGRKPPLFRLCRLEIRNVLCEYGYRKGPAVALEDVQA